MSLVDKILYEADVMDQKITNSATGRKVKVSTALTYPDSEPVKKKALQLVKKSKPKDTNTKEKKSTSKLSTTKKNSRSHKPKSNSYGISKECVAFLKEKGLTNLNVLPQSFVTIDQIQFNPALKDNNKDEVWAVKFPVKLPNGKDSYKTAYTKEFMKKSQVKKYKKISKISSKDIQSLEEKTAKLLEHKEKTISDSACILSIILKTGLRIGSVDDGASGGTGNLGVRTLKVENITIKGKKAHLKFIGKSYQENVAELDDPKIVNYLSENLKGKQSKDRVFSASYGLVGKVMEKINPKGINPKDLRTYKATEIAKNALQDKKLGAPPPLPENEKEIKKVVKQKLTKVFEVVAQALNNTPTMAKNSYIHPVVITDYLKSLNLQPKAVGYKHITMEAKESKSNTTKFTTMDEMFTQNKNYGEGVNDSNINEEDMYDCEEYDLPEWFWNDEIDLVKIK